MGNNQQGFSYNMSSTQADLEEILASGSASRSADDAQVSPGSSSKRSRADGILASLKRGSKRASRRAPQPVPSDVAALRGQADQLSKQAKSDRARMMEARKQANKQCSELKKSANALGAGIKKQRNQAKQLRRKAAVMLRRSRKRTARCASVSVPSKENCAEAKCGFRKEYTKKNGKV